MHAQKNTTAVGEGKDVDVVHEAADTHTQTHTGVHVSVI
jgi:hypothetical protein